MIKYKLADIALTALAAWVVTSRVDELHDRAQSRSSTDNDWILLRIVERLRDDWVRSIARRAPEPRPDRDAMSQLVAPLVPAFRDAAVAVIASDSGTDATSVEKYFAGAAVDGAVSERIARTLAAYGLTPKPPWSER